MTKTVANISIKFKTYAIKNSAYIIKKKLRVCVKNMNLSESFVIRIELTRYNFFYKLFFAYRGIDLLRRDKKPMC